MMIKNTFFRGIIILQYMARQKPEAGMVRAIRRRGVGTKSFDEEVGMDEYDVLKERAYRAYRRKFGEYADEPCHDDDRFSVRFVNDKQYVYFGNNAKLLACLSRRNGRTPGQARQARTCSERNTRHLGCVKAEGGWLAGWPPFLGKG
jgi:hypothetical protein